MQEGQDNLAAALLERALQDGWADRIALREGSRHLTYGQLHDQVARTATALRTLRIAKGDRVALVMPDTLEAAVAILGVIYHGAIAVPMSELGRAIDLRDLLNDCGAAAVVVHSSLRPAIDEVRNETPSVREVIVVGDRGPGERDFVSLMRGAAPANKPALVDPESTAVILYSAGAHAEGDEGGGRRGVPHTHATPLRAYHSLFRNYLGVQEGDRVVSVVRLWTAFGLGTGLFFPLAAGAETHLLPEQPTSRAVLSLIDGFKPSVLFATPSVYGQLANDAHSLGMDKPLAGLRHCVSGAEDMPPKVVASVRDFLGAEVTVGYGLTEAFQFVLCGIASDGRPGACGQPLSGFETRVVDDRGQPVGVDEIGTLEIRGPTLNTNYWGEADHGSAGKWFTTRDRFMADAEGHYYHCGRVDHLFKVGGKWVSPFEVEQALLANEAVWECAVVGADDEDGLIKPLAFVVPNIGHEPGPELEKSLRIYVKRELAPYKYPRWIEFVDELPKGPHGKILRYRLRDWLRGNEKPRRAETVGPV